MPWRNRQTSGIEIAVLIFSLAGVGCDSSVGGSNEPREIVPQGNRRNPEAVAKLKNGDRQLANAAWWGFDAVDTTDAVQSAINSGAAKVVIPYVGADWNVRPLRLASRQEIFFEPGVIVAAKKGDFAGPNDCLFRGQEVDHVVLRGHGAVLRMRKDDYRESPYVKAEWRHTLGLFGATDVTVQGLTLETSGGDGIYIGATGDNRRVPCRKIRIQDCICHDNYRQGISIVSAENVRIERCTLRDTRGTLPRGGIDFEPSDSSDLLADVEVRNCRAENNAGGGFVIGLSQLNERSSPVSVRVEDCLVRGPMSSGVIAFLKTEKSPSGIVEFRNCTYENLAYPGVFSVWNAAAPVKIRFINCKWRDVAQRAGESPIALEFLKEGGSAEQAGFEFLDCYMYDDKDRPFAKITRGPGKMEAAPLSGALTLVNKRGGRLDASAGKALIGLEVRYLENQD